MSLWSRSEQNHVLEPLSTQLHIWAWLAGVPCPISSFSCNSKHSFLQDSQYKNLLHSFSAAVDLAIHCSYRLLSETLFLTSSCQQTRPTILNAFNIWLVMILQLWRPLSCGKKIIMEGCYLLPYFQTVGKLVSSKFSINLCGPKRDFQEIFQNSYWN